MKLNLDKNKKYILACSCGPDSMCLFDLLIKGKYKFVVAHVNYHLRSEEKKEIENLKNICRKNKIKLFIKDFYIPKNVNEEGWAREVRYSWFEELAKQEKINSVLVAHNEDDLIETYLLQKDRKSIVSYYGLNNKIKFKNIELLRPLLNFSKQQLLNYCNENNVFYGIDLSNFDTKFKRNFLRKNIVSKMNKEERKNIKNIIKNENLEIEKFKKENKNIFKNKSLKISNLLKYSFEDLQKILILNINFKNIRFDISLGFAKEIYSLIRTKKSWHKEFDNNIIFSIDYGYFGIYEILNEQENKIKINKKSSKYPLIKNLKYEIKFSLNLGTRIKLKIGSKTLGRCYIDWKVPYAYRKVYPVIVDENKNVIYIPRFKKDYKNDKDSLLVFNFNDFVN